MIFSLILLSLTTPKTRQAHAVQQELLNIEDHFLKLMPAALGLLWMGWEPRGSCLEAGQTEHGNAESKHLIVVNTQRAIHEG